MQRQYAKDELFYLEFSEVEKNKFNFHLSFMSKKNAWNFFCRAKYRWHLPVAIEGNRVIIFEGEGKVEQEYRSEYEFDPGTKYGVFCDGNRVGIHFFCEEHAREFHECDLYDIKSDLEGRDLVKYSRAGTCQNNNYCFQKNSVIHPDYSLKKRANQLQLMNKLLDLSLVAHCFDVPNDVIFHMARMSIILNDIFLSRRYLVLNKIFLLDTQRVPVSRYKKIDIQTEYVWHKGTFRNFGTNGWGDRTYYWASMSLCCANTYDAKILCTRLKESTVLDVKLNGNKINILPYPDIDIAESDSFNFLYDLKIWENEDKNLCSGGIKFNNAYNAQNFVDTVTIADETLVVDESFGYAYVSLDKFEIIYRGYSKSLRDRHGFFEVKKDIPGQITGITNLIFPAIDNLIERMNDSAVKSWFLERINSEADMKMRNELREKCIVCLSKLKIYISEGLQERKSLVQILNDWRAANRASLDVISAIAGGKEGEWIEDLITQIQEKNLELHLFRP